MANINTLELYRKTQRRFLECGVCTEIYNEEDRVPRQLPCFHTFCSACLKIICSKRNNIECSLCKASHKVNKKGPENFGKDNTRRDLLLFLRENASENGLLLCGKCSEIMTEWFNCDTCSIILCSECKVFHEKKYSNGPLKYYCVSTTCRVGVCSTCIVELHRDSTYHQLKDMTLFIQDKKDSLQSDIILLKDKIFIAYTLIEKSNSNMDVFMIRKEMLKIKIDGLYEAGWKKPELYRHKLVKKYGQIFQELDELRSTAIENLQKFITDAEYCILSSEQILNQKSMITLLNLGQSETNQMHDFIEMDLDVFEDKSAFKTIENNVTMLEQTIDNLKTLQGNVDQGCNSRQPLIQRIPPHIRITNIMQNIHQRLDRGMQNLRQGRDRGMQNLRQGRDRGMQNLRHGRDEGMQNLRQGLDRGRQNLQHGRDRAQMIIRYMYNTTLQSMEKIPWKDTIEILVLTVLFCLLLMSQLRADYFFNGIKLMEYQFDTSKPSNFTCSSSDRKVVSTMPLAAGVYRCGPGTFTHGGVFGNKSFAVEEKARFVLTLTYQEHNYYVHDTEVENKLVFEFGFTLNTIIEDHLYQKENVWAISGYRCHNVYDMCLILTYPNQSNVNTHQSLWLGHEYSVFTEKYNSGIVMGRLTLVLNRQTRTLLILTKSQTFHFDLIDDKQLNGNVWPVFLIHENNGVLPLSATIGKNSRFSYDPSSLQPNYFLSEDNNTVSTVESTNTKYVNNKTRYMYTMPETFQPYVKHIYTRFRIRFNRNQFEKVGQNLFEFGFGIVQDKLFKSLVKTKCKTCLTNDGANIGLCLENSLASVTKQTFYEYVDLKWDIFVHFDLNTNKLNVLTLPCDTCSYYHQTVSLDSKIYCKLHKFYFGLYNTPMMMVVSNLTMTVANVNSMHNI